MRELNDAEVGDYVNYRVYADYRLSLEGGI